VPKQQYCPKCGKLLIKNYKNPTSKTKLPEDAKNIEEPVKKEEDTTEQLETLREKIKMMENSRKKAIKEEKKSEEVIFEPEESESIVGDAFMVKTLESKDIVLDDDVRGLDLHLESELGFTPDKYTMDTVQKLAKNIKYESHLVKILSEDGMNEETFLGLYKNLIEDTHRLILRRSEIIREIDSSMGNYEYIIKTAQQGMKLLDIRVSIDDASEEEYKVKAAAYKWDINHYDNKIKFEEARANYLRNLGSLIDAEELDTLIGDVNESISKAGKLNVSEETRGKIQSSMKEALNLLKDFSSN
jgi:hypothetical protein